jgi:thioredoxin 2
MSTKLERPTVQVTCRNCQAKNRIPTAADGVPRCGRCHEALPWIVDASDETFEAVMEVATIPVLLDVWAPWCGPCRRVSPALEQLAGELAGKFKLVKVNADESPRVSGRFDVQAIPTLLLLHGGEVLAVQVGAAPATQLRTWLTENLEAMKS